MKRKYLIYFIGMLITCIACEKELPSFKTEQDHLNFPIDPVTKIVLPVRKTFVYDSASVRRDTVYATVNAMGFVRDYPRSFRVEQISYKEDSIWNAIPGTHYVALDDPEVVKEMIIPAGEVSGKIPIIALRDASLRDTSVLLRLKIVANDVFLPGDPDRLELSVEIGDQLMQPSNWMVFGAYGKVKHRFLVEHFPPMRFDEETFDDFRNDLQYGRFINSKAKNLLAQENAQREAEGKGPLCEADGTEVKFP